MRTFYLRYNSKFGFLLLASFLLLGPPAVAQQQNPDEIPGVGTDRGADFGNDTNYGLSPNAQSFDQQTNPVNYPNPEEVNRNSISISPVGISQGFLYVEWEHLAGRMFGIVFGVSLYASELSMTRRMFKPAAVDNNFFMILGGIFGFTFYVAQQYVRGLAIQIKFGGGILAGSYKEGQRNAVTVQDFYGSAMAIIAYRFNVTRNIALSLIGNINPNVVIVASDYASATTVPIYYAINNHSDMIGLSTPAPLTDNLLLFIHFGIGFDLTFTF